MSVGTAGTGGTCNPCEAEYSYQDEVGQSECKSLPSNSRSTIDFDVATNFQCNDGYQKTNDEELCEECPQGYAGTGGTCNPCDRDNSYQDEVGQSECKSLPSNSRSTISFGVATNFQCNDGYQKTSIGELCYLHRQIVNNERTSCQDCPVNSNPNDEKTQCICDEGYYMRGETCVVLDDNQQNLVNKINNDNNSLNRGCK